MTHLRLSEHALDDGDQVLGDINGLLGNKLVDQSPVEGAHRHVFIRLPSQQHPASRPVHQFAQSLQAIHAGHGVVEHADFGQSETFGMVGPVVQDLWNQWPSGAPVLDHLLLHPSIGLPQRRLLLQLVDAGLRPQIQLDVPLARQHHRQHFQISRVIVKENDGTRTME